jgi:hypothetical protein
MLMCRMSDDALWLSMTKAKAGCPSEPADGPEQAEVLQCTQCGVEWLPVYSTPSKTIMARRANHGPYLGCSDRYEDWSQKETPATDAMRCSSRLGPPTTPSHW